MTYRLDDPAAAGAAPPLSYQDWYLIEDTAALDAVEAAAVGAAASSAHDRVAGLSGSGAGGLYRLASGAATSRLAADRCAWLDRPRGMTARDAIAALRDAVSASSEAGSAPADVASALRELPAIAIWQRRLSLGPAAEFAIALPAGFVLAQPPGWTLALVPRTRVAAWSDVRVRAG